MSNLLFFVYFMQNNKVLILLDLIVSFFVSMFSSVILIFQALLWKKTKPIVENKFLDSFNFLFNIWPRSFWKKPNSLKMGRSISTFIHYVFYKNENFKKISKK